MAGRPHSCGPGAWSLKQDRRSWGAATRAWAIEAAKEEAARANAKAQEAKRLERTEAALLQNAGGNPRDVPTEASEAAGGAAGVALATAPCSSGSSVSVCCVRACKTCGHTTCTGDTC